jgi:hypothetical protein
VQTRPVLSRNSPGRTEENHGKIQSEKPLIFIWGLFNDAVSTSDYIALDNTIINE